MHYAKARRFWITEVLYLRSQRTASCLRPMPSGAKTRPRTDLRKIGVSTPSRRLVPRELRPDLRAYDTPGSHSLNRGGPSGMLRPWTRCLPRLPSSSFSPVTPRISHSLVSVSFLALADDSLVGTGFRLRLGSACNRDPWRWRPSAWPERADTACRRRRPLHPRTVAPTGGRDRCVVRVCERSQTRPRRRRRAV